MGGKNAYLARQNAIYDEMLNRGRRHGEQCAMDCVEIALHRKGWGYKRIKELIDLVSDVADYYTPAMMPNMEQDVFQERMDNEIKSFMPADVPFYPFADRYPVVRTAGYDKMPKR